MPNIHTLSSLSPSPPPFIPSNPNPHTLKPPFPINRPPKPHTDRINYTQGRRLRSWDRPHDAGAAGARLRALVPFNQNRGFRFERPSLQMERVQWGKKTQSRGRRAGIRADLGLGRLESGEKEGKEVGTSPVVFIPCPPDIRPPSLSQPSRRILGKRARTARTAKPTPNPAAPEPAAPPRHKPRRTPPSKTTKALKKSKSQNMRRSARIAAKKRVKEDLAGLKEKLYGDLDRSEHRGIEREGKMAVEGKSTKEKVRSWLKGLR